MPYHACIVSHAQVRAVTDRLRHLDFQGRGQSVTKKCLEANLNVVAPLCTLTTVLCSTESSSGCDRVKGQRSGNRRSCLRSLSRKSNRRGLAQPSPNTNSQEFHTHAEKRSQTCTCKFARSARFLLRLLRASPYFQEPSRQTSNMNINCLSGKQKRDKQEVSFKKQILIVADTSHSFFASSCSATEDAMLKREGEMPKYLRAAGAVVVM
eukprot:328845-Pleurochrysis_carterae.AAC.3